MKRLAIGIFVLGTMPLLAKAQALESLYTDLTRCKTIQVDKETQSSVQKCPGVAGYELRVSDDGLRQSIDVIDPQGKSHSLDFWSVITGGFTKLGPKAEWRVEKSGGKILPRALIVRLDAWETPDEQKRTTSYLVITKITGEKICATEKIPAGPQQNEKARVAADAAATKACLEKERQ